MPPSATLVAGDRDVLVELAPVLRRAVALDPASLVRFRLAHDRATALIRLPFGVLVSRAVAGGRPEPLDVAVGAADTLAWIDGSSTAVPASRDHEWRSGLPPADGWTRLETVPDDVIRPLVRQGAMTLKDAAAREGVPGAQPRADVADVLLDSVVLTVTSATAADTAEVTLRVLSALTRMGFLRKDGHAHVDVAGRWIRVVGEFGSVYRERPGSGLGML